MNKKTTLLAILGLVTVSGAGYLYTTGQTTQLPQQIGQYLPEAVRSYLPASFSPEAVADEVLEEVAETENTVVEEMVVEEIAAAAEETGTEQAMTDSPAEDNIMEQNSVDDSMINAEINREIISEIEKSVSESSLNSKETIKAVDSKTIDSAVTLEMQELQQRLVQVKSELGGLDNEKSELEGKFQAVLKQNRELAMKLKEIDQQLEVNMK